MFSISSPTSSGVPQTANVFAAFDGEKLSELNRWKFNALKLDYLIREMIKLGAKNNETLDVVLDLHEDIVLDEVSEWYKDIAGVPSTFTNIT